MTLRSSWGGRAEGSAVAKTVSKVVLPVAVAVDAGLRVRDGVETEQRFAAGAITLQQREVAHARNAAGMAGGWAGAWAGAEIEEQLGEGQRAPLSLPVQAQLLAESSSALLAA